ncbi:hypothetical protein L6452_02740 [Arctium lappa]|uniref:Uncharacterized protein n=1 Tax=Arctium lappa TaxID=4217 RepID=A0ACB9FL42_ARCLA|nr:hypothetical protein L6452_02740 [Arctium lappa]
MMHPNRGNKNTFVGGLGSDEAKASRKGRKRKRSSKRVDMKREATNHETKSNEHMPTMMDEGSSRSRMPRVNELLNTIVEKIASIKRFKKEADDDIHYGLTNFEHKDRFISLRCKMDSLFNSTASGERTPNTTKKMRLVNECRDIVLSEQVDDPLVELWESPTYVAQVCESMRESVENSKAIKFLNVIEPPGFDLGISPEKDLQTEQVEVVCASGSGVTKDKGNGKLFDDNHAQEESGFIRGVTESRFQEVVSNIAGSDSSEQLFDEKNVKKVISPKKEKHDPIADNAGITHNHPPMDNITRVRPTRRTVKLGDPLKSPDTMFRTNDCVHIFRTGLETLARTNMNVSPSVIDGWASILNYEERFRNRDSIRRYFFSVEMMADPLLRMRAVDENTHYGIFRGKLAKAERYQRKLMEMRDIDLNDMKKEIDRFTSLDPDIKSQILRQARESRSSSNILEHMLYGLAL